MNEPETITDLSQIIDFFYRQVAVKECILRGEICLWIVHSS